MRLVQGARRAAGVALGICLALGSASFAGGGELARRVDALEAGMGTALAVTGDVQLAQLFRRPPVDIPDTPEIAPVQDDPGDGEAAGLAVRIDRLENGLRSLTGQIEQNQFAIRQLQEQLRRLQQDVDLRPPDAGRGGTRPGKRADAGEAGDPPPAVVPPVAPPRRRGDAFDPDAQPDAPGGPRPLGVLPGGPLPPAAAALPGPVGLGGDPDAPLDLSRGGPVPPAGRPPESVAALPGPAAIGPGGASPPPAPRPPASARDEYDATFALFKQSQFEPAQTGFEAFVQKYPKDRLVPDAVYFLGETYAQRGRHREAAEQFLKLATDYAKSSRAPDGLVRLGMSLNALGAKDQACATFGEVNRRYPNASTTVKTNVDRELKRAKC